MGYLSEGQFEKAHAMVADFKCLKAMYRGEMGSLLISTSFRFTGHLTTHCIHIYNNDLKSYFFSPFQS